MTLLTIDELAEFTRDGLTALIDRAIIHRVQQEQRVQRYIDMLCVPEPDDRALAAEKLGELGAKANKAIPALCRALKDQHVEVRRKVANTLSRIGHKDAIPALAEALKDGDLDVCSQAVHALSVIGKDSTVAVPELIRCLSKDERPHLRKIIAELLGKIGGDSSLVVPPLEESLKDKDANVRAAVCQALGSFGPAAAVAIPSLFTLIRDTTPGSDIVRGFAAFALGKIGQATPDVLQALKITLQDSHRDPRRYAAAAIGNFKSVAREELKALIDLFGDRDPLVRAAATEAVGKIGGPAAQISTNLEKMLHDDSRDVREKAAEALGNIGPDAVSAVSQLERITEDESQPGLVRVQSALALYKIKGDSRLSMRVLTNLVITPGTHEAAGKAILSLGAVASETVPTLIVALKSQHWFVRSNAAFVLGELGQKAEPAITALATVLLDEFVGDVNLASTTWAGGPIYDLVRHRAAEALGKIGPASSNALPALREARKFREEVRLAVEAAIRNIEKDV